MSHFGKGSCVYWDLGRSSSFFPSACLPDLGTFGTPLHLFAHTRQQLLDILVLLRPFRGTRGTAWPTLCVGIVPSGSQLRALFRSVWFERKGFAMSATGRQNTPFSFPRPCFPARGRPAPSSPPSSLRPQELLCRQRCVPRGVLPTWVMDSPTCTACSSCCCASFQCRTAACTCCCSYCIRFVSVIHRSTKSA